MAYDRAGGRAQQSVASRVRNAEERLRRLLAQPVPPPPQPLRFTPPATVSGPVAGDAPGARAGGAVREAGAARAEPAPALLEAGGVGVTGRLSPVALVVVSHDRRLRQRWRGAHLVLRSDAAPGRGAGGRATRGGTSRRGSR